MKKTNKKAIVNGWGATKTRVVYEDEYGNEYIIMNQVMTQIAELWALNIRIIEQ